MEEEIIKNYNLWIKTKDLNYFTKIYNLMQIYMEAV